MSRHSFKKSAKSLCEPYFALHYEVNDQAYSIGDITKPVEGASTIKVPILMLACLKNQTTSKNLGELLQTRPHHLSNGSGVLQWLDLPTKQYTFRELCYYMIASSDCMATNILIDYIGGAGNLNYWLQSNGFATKLNMQYIRFDESRTEESVCTTNAKDLQRMFSLLMQYSWEKPYRRFINAATTTLDQSWVGQYTPRQIPSIRGKSGSMIDYGNLHRTTINLLGDFTYKNQLISFGLVSSGRSVGHQASERLRNTIIHRFITESYKVMSYV